MEHPTDIYPNRQQALQNIERFYAGKPCKRCNSIKRYTKTGGCVNCAKDRQPSDSRRLHSRQWKQNNKAKVIAYRKQWHQANKEKENQSNRARRMQYVTDDPKYDVNKRHRFAVQNRPSYLASKRVAASKRRSRKLSAEGTHSTKDWMSLKAQYDNQCLCCGVSDLIESLTEDHIVPLSSGGTNYITNIQPLCMQCNSENFKRFRKFGAQTDFRLR